MLHSGQKWNSKRIQWSILICRECRHSAAIREDNNHTRTVCLSASLEVNVNKDVPIDR